MKIRIAIVLTLGMFVSVYSQKDELKALQKSFKKGDFEQTVKLIDQYKDLLGKADTKTKDKFTEMQILSYIELAKKDSKKDEYTPKAISAFSEASDKLKTKLIPQKQTLLLDTHKQAVEYYNKKDYNKSSDYFEWLYRLSPADTVYLYSAASLAVNDKNIYDKALKYYNKLSELNYSGESVEYSAINNETGEREVLAKNQRDLGVKLKTHKDPQDKKLPSKKSEIYKNIALIYTAQKKKEKAYEALDKAIVKNPGDTDLLFSKADLYYDDGKYEDYKNTIEEIIKIDPNNSELYYNVGVSYSKNKDYAPAVPYYQKALEVKPDFQNAAMNLSSAFLEQGNMKIKEMNKLSENRNHDEKKYDRLNMEKEDFYKKSAEVLENLIKNSKGKLESNVLVQLKNIYGGLGDTSNYKRVKAMIETNK